MTLTEPLETIEVTEAEVACDGGGALGHPRVYLNMGKNDHIDCPYCGRRYQRKLEAAGSASRH